MAKNINSKTDLVTKDMVPGEAEEQNFDFPSLGVSVRAKSMNEALIKAKELKNSKK